MDARLFSSIIICWRPTGRSHRMKRIAVLFAVACVLAVAACGGDDKKPPMTPDNDKPAELIDAGATTSPPSSK